MLRIFNNGYSDSTKHICCCSSPTNHHNFYLHNPLQKETKSTFFLASLLFILKAYNENCPALNNYVKVAGYYAM